MRRARRVLLVAAALFAAWPSGRAVAAKLFSLSLDDVARGRAEIVDLTHNLQENGPLFPGGVPFTLEPLTRLSDGYYMNTFTSGEHTGTHVDAPAHFGKGLPTVDEIPAVRLVVRMRRTHAFAVTTALFALSLLAVLPATLIHSELAAASLLACVAIVFGIGECVHTVVQVPVVADMAPPHLLGRYMSIFGLSFTLSQALGPAIGGLLLQTSPDAVWWGGALAALLAGAVLLRLGGRIPDPLREAQSRPASAPEAA